MKLILIIIAFLILTSLLSGCVGYFNESYYSCKLKPTNKTINK